MGGRGLDDLGHEAHPVDGCADLARVLAGPQRPAQRGRLQLPVHAVDEVAAPKWRGCIQTRDEQRTPSDSASTRTPVATSWRAASWATNRSAVVRTLKVIASTESSGGSNGTSTSSSGGGWRAANRAWSSPRARRRTAAP